MWMKILRPMSSGAICSIEPALPDMFICPMRSPVLLSKPLGNHLVIGVERAVEEEERRPFDPCAQRVVELGAAGDIEEVVPACGVGDFQAGGIAFLRAETGPGLLVLEIKRDLARHREGLDGHAHADPPGLRPRTAGRRP